MIDQISKYTMNKLLFTIKFQHLLLYLLLLLNQSQSTLVVYKNFYESSSLIDLDVIYNQDVCNVEVASCGTQQILKVNYCSSSEYDLVIYQTFELKPHYQVTISFNFWRIDQWDNYQFYLYADHQIIYENTYSDTTIATNICGSSGYSDEVIPISRTFEHSSTTILLVMIVQKGVWGISEFSLSIENCIAGCNSCDQTGCFDQILFLQQFVSKNIGSINAIDGWLSNGVIETFVGNCSGIKCLRVFQLQLEKTYQLEIHSKISFSIRVFILNSYETEIKILIDDVIVYYTQYSGGWIEVNSIYEFCYFLTQRQINIRQYPHSGSTVKITILTTQNKYHHVTYPWMCIRDVQLFLGSNSNQNLCVDNNNFAFDGCFSFIYDCVEGCNNCIKGTCIDCLIGWQFQAFDQSCIPICGDSIITSFEVCDDGNQIPYDGCYQCQFSCILDCLLCEFGKCLECNPFFELSYDKQECLRKCDDNAISKYYGYYYDFKDQCSYCQLECQLCINSQCYLCEYGWQLKDNHCYQLCGDGQIAQYSIEQCDDGNNISDDGCFQCQLECFPYCLFCLDIYTCLICQDNFQIVEQFCLPICGDGIIITELEDCDDGNNQPYDGCFECQFQCSYGCLDCEKGNICKKCDNQYVLNQDTAICYEQDIEEILYGNQSVTNISLITECSSFDTMIDIQCNFICGDGILNNQEECDDNNLNNLDGCSNRCKIENKWGCVQTIFQSKCFLLTSLSLQFINQTNSYQYVQLQFSNLIKLNESIFNLIPRIKVQIDNISLEQYNYSIQDVIAVDQFELKEATYLFTIQFYQSIIDLPTLIVSIDASLVDENNFKVDTSQKKLKLQASIILNSDQAAAAIKLYNFGLWIIIGLAISSLLLIIFGELSQFTEILDVLQYQSFLRFINVRYPENLIIYFQSSELITLQPILIKLKINSLFENLFDSHYLEGPGKLQEYQINADLLTNLQGQFTQLALFLLLYCFLKYFKRFLFNYWFTNKYFLRVKLIKSTFINCATIKGYFMSKKVLAMQSLYKVQGMTQIFYANSWDLSFKAILFLISINSLTLRSTISLFLTILYFFIILIIINQNFNNSNFKLMLKVGKIKRLEIIILIKKLLFLTILIGIQNYPIFQCFLLAFINFSYVLFIIIMKFKSIDIDLITIVWLETPVMLFTLLNIAYIKEFIYYFLPNQLINYGFCQIGILIFGLLGPLFKCFINFYQKAQPLLSKCRMEKGKQINQPKTIFIDVNQ
ncbi:unnamed protein product [Paramecium primaurelia]|uniref:Uncharacterized protein n=1 Tax=Paramecium primaurelia TaxID=5886 RepID=A0A8S1Q2N4_PARPR|nr:unnamed protein product [Paramecium primaurelia]